jgi:hypothetical protein
LLESLITSKTRLKILLKFFLNPETSAYLQELATEFGVSSNGIRIELNRLTKASLLSSEPEGRTILYRANSEHSLFKDIRSVVRKYTGIDIIVENFVSEMGELKAAWIIGDYAKGLDSGLIDIVLVGDIDVNILQDVVKKSSKLIQRKIRTIVLSPSEFESLRTRLDIDNALPFWNTAKVEAN